ncbi:hypothetical protein [Enterococcus lactis]
MGPAYVVVMAFYDLAKTTALGLEKHAQMIRPIVLYEKHEQRFRGTGTWT